MDLQVSSKEPIVILMPVPISYSVNASSGPQWAKVIQTHRYIARENSENKTHQEKKDASLKQLLIVQDTCWL